MSNPELNDLTALMQQLSAAVEHVSPTDLPTLAKMHGWAQAVLECDDAAEGLVAELIELLEGLILGTVENAEEALRRTGAIIGELGAAAPTGSASADSAPAETTSDEPIAGLEACEGASADAAGETVASGSAVERAIEDLLGQLSAAVQTVDQYDLSGLAQMHTWCEQLVEAANAAHPEMSPQAKQLASTLEDIILSVTSDPGAAIRGIAEQVEQLSGLLSGEGVTDFSQLSDEQLSAQLADMFDQAADPSTAPAAEDKAASEAPVDATATQEASEAAGEKTGGTGAATPSGGNAADSGNPPAYVPEPLFIDPTEVEFVGAFIEEAGEHIASIETALLEVEQTPGDTDKINELFRPFHTIKGMAGFLNLRDVNCLTHEVETLLDQGRRGERTMSPGIIDIVFSVIDKLKAQIASIGGYVGNPTGEPVPQPSVAEMIEHLRGVVAGTINPDDGQTSSGEAEARAAAEAPSAPATSETSEAPASGSAGSAPSGLGGAAKAAATLGEQSVRIDTEKLDALVDMVGELVIAQTLITANEKIADDPRLSKDAGQVSKIVRDVQEVAMSMRMIPIKSTFQKMARLVRDLSRKAGKQVELTISGEETELDKNVIQQIGDPLVHMVRNAVDHGIETPEVREGAGKSAVGRIHLNAYHHGGNIVIEISDDGKGLDPEALVKKALEKGIIQPDDKLTDEQAYHLVFAPGFSTAAQITDISGRGVGMDVVKRNIEQLRGRVEIQSQKGKGSVFTIRLPLTLAIIDGMLVRLGEERFIIATTAIEQALRPTPGQITTVQQRGEVLQVRGRLIPLVQFGQMFGMSPRLDPCSAMVVIAHSDRGQIGLMVEELIGQQQVVIKSLGEGFRELQGVSGAAILGDGRVGLILDASGIFSAYEAWRGARLNAKRGIATDTVEASTAEVDDAEAEGCATTDDEKAPVLAGAAQAGE